MPNRMWAAAHDANRPIRPIQFAKWEEVLFLALVGLVLLGTPTVFLLIKLKDVLVHIFGS